MAKPAIQTPTPSVWWKVLSGKVTPGNDYYTLAAINGPQALVDATVPANYTCTNCVAAADTDHFFQGNASTKISVSGAQSSISWTMPITNAVLVAGSGRIGLAINLGAASNTGSIQFEVGDGASFTNKWLKFSDQGSAGMASRELSGYWTAYVADMTTGTPTGSPVLANMTTLRVTVNFSSSNTNESQLWVGKVASAPPTKAKAIITFDDLHDSFFTLGYLEAKSRGLPVACAVAKSKIDSGSTYMTSAHLNTILSDSSGLFTAINHTDTHPDLTGISLSAALTEISTCDTYLQTLPKFDRRFVVYPYGAYTVALEEALRNLTTINGSGYKLGREVGAGNLSFNHMWLDEGFRNMRNPTCVLLDSSTTLAQAKTKFDSAVARGDAIFITGHKLDVSAAGVDQWLLADFQNFLDYIVTKQSAALVDCVSWASYYDNMKPSGRAYTQPTARTAPFYVKSSGAVNPNLTAQATATITFTNEIPVGDFVSVAVSFGLASTPTATLVDTAGNTWTRDKVQDVTTGATVHQWLYSTVVTNKIVNGNTLVFTPSASVNYPVMDARHFSQAPGKTLVVDQSSTATGTSTAPAPGSITPAVNKEVVIAALESDVTTYVATTMTEMLNVSNTTKRAASQYQIQSTAQAINPTGTLGASKQWAMVAVSYEQSP